MAVWVCAVCGYMYDESAEELPWAELPDNWTCPVCGNGKEFYYTREPAVQGAATEVSDESVPTETVGGPDSAEAADRPASAEAAKSSAPAPPADGRSQDVALKPLGEAAESQLVDINLMAETGQSIIEPMRTREPVISWDEILILGAQIARLPLNDSDAVSIRTVLGPAAVKPLELDSPVIISHMSFGALSKAAKLSLAIGSAGANTAMSSGEGGILPEALERSHRYIFEYVPNRYSVTKDHLAKVDAVEIKLGQSAKPGMGGHLPGNKVTPEIAAIRGFATGQDILSPAHHDDIKTAADLKSKVAWLREATGGRPIGIKLAAGNLEDDLAVVLESGPDFITIDGRAGATGAAPKCIKRSTSVPTLFAVDRARTIMDKAGSRASLIITGGLRVSSDFAKAIALGADAVAIGTAALIAIGCRQYRICHTGQCPMGIATQDPQLQANLDVEIAARRLHRFLEVCNEELRMFARLTGHADIHDMSPADLCTVNSEISEHTSIAHA